MILRSRLRWLFLTAILLLAARDSRAQSDPFDRFAHRAYDQDDGLPETLVNSVAQTPDGYLWLGTRRGLARFDGLRFQLFSTERVPQLPGDIITRLLADRSGRLWIGTGRGLAVLERGHFRSIGEVDGISKAEVTALFEDSKGTIWVATAEKIFRADAARFVAVGGPAVRAVGFAEDRRGRVWVADTTHLYLVNAGLLTAVSIADFGSTTIGAIAANRRGDLWLGVRGGIVPVDSVEGRGWKAGRLIRAVDQASPLIRVLAFDASDNAWLGSATHGLAIWDGERVSRFGLDRGLSSLEINGIVFDARGRSWIGSGAALDLFQPSAFATLSYADGFPHALIWSVADGGAGRVLAAAEDGGIYRFDGHRTVAISPPIAADAGETPYSMRPDGELFIAPRRASILRITADGRRLPIPKLTPPEGMFVRSLFTSRDSALWITSDSGIYRWKNDSLESMHQVAGLPADTRIRAVVEDSVGRIWLARPGLVRIDEGRATYFDSAHGLTDPLVLAVFPKGKDLWVGTADSGLFLLRRDRVTSFGRIDRRLRGEVHGIVEDNRGYLWLTSSFGLLRVRRAELEAAADGRTEPLSVRRFDRLDGLATTEFNGSYRPSLFKDSSGYLWLPSYVGVVRVDPDRIAADSAPPQVHIERVAVDGQERSIGDRLELPAGVGRVAIEFAATDAPIPERVRIQYRLEGIDKEWVEAGPRRVVLFGPMRGGKYRFVVRAANEDGRWSEANTSLAFSVQLRLHEHRWFAPLLVLVVLAVVAIAYRWRVRQMRLRAQELERLVDERTRDLLLAQDTLEHRVADRTSELADELAERKRLQHQLLQSQKLESIGRLAGGVAHEINNMMTGVLGFAEMAEAEAKGNQKLVDDLRQITVAGQRVAQITRQLLTFARRQASKRSAIDVSELVTSLERFLLRIVGENVDLVIKAPGGLARINADPSQVEQLIVNLVMNAKDAIATTGQVTIEVRAESFEELRQVGSFELLPGEYAVISVTDTGAGISSEVRGRLFEPFFTTKEVNRGTGLGLSVCYGIVSQHAGAIAVESELGKGSRFEAYFPAGVVTEEPAVASAPVQTLPRGAERLLVVEDEHAVRQVAVRTLENLGYEVVEAADGASALDRFRAEPDRFDLVLTDLVMPRMGGVELASALRELRADVPVIFMSGYAGRESNGHPGLAGPTLEKPFTRSALAGAVRRELDRVSRPASASGNGG